MSLKEVFEMIEKGTCVVLRSDENPRVQVYHKNPEDKSLAVFITLNGHSATLLNEGEWGWYLSTTAECRRIRLTDEELKGFTKSEYYYMTM